MKKVLMLLCALFCLMIAGGLIGCTIEAELTLEASWKKYEITLDAYPGTVKNETIKKYNGVGWSELPKADEGSNPGYRFVGWMDENGTITTSDYIVTGPMTLYALWVAN